MTSRQQIAFDNPLLSFLYAKDELFRERRVLPTGMIYQTIITLDAFERPFSWHVAAGFLRVDETPISVALWDDSMKVLAMNDVKALIAGVGRRDGGEHWDKAEIHRMTFQAWRRCSPEENAAVERYREAMKPCFTLFPNSWEALQRSTVIN